MQKIYPCLWFDGQAEEAARLYTSLFPRSKIGRAACYGKSASQASGQKEGTTMTVEFELEGQRILGLNGGAHFKFSPALSFFVLRNSEEAIDRLWEGLSSGGETRMPLNKYPWAEKYGWTTDRFGVEWQLMLTPQEQKIVPAFLFVKEQFGKGEEAIHFYQSVFKNSKIDSLSRDEATKTIQHCAFSLEGVGFVLMEGQGEHNFTFTPAFSLVVDCQNQQEIDDYWAKLSAGGSPGHCGWLTDKYGVSWQIVPSGLSELMAVPQQAENVMAALVEMKKLDLSRLEAAAQQAGSKA